MTSITRRCRSVSPELSARIPGGRPGRDRLCPSGFVASFIECTGSSRPWERSWAVMVALSAVVVTSAPLDGLPCSATVVAFERLRQTHVRVKNWGWSAVIRCLGVWLIPRRADKRAHCCTLHRRGDDLVGRCPSLPPAGPSTGIRPPPHVVLTVSPHVPQRYGRAGTGPPWRYGHAAHANTGATRGYGMDVRANPHI